MYFIQVVSQSMLKNCLQGMLAQQQRETLVYLLDVLKMFLQDCHMQSTLEQLEKDMNEAIALLES